MQLKKLLTAGLFAAVVPFSLVGCGLFGGGSSSDSPGDFSLKFKINTDEANTQSPCDDAATTACTDGSSFKFTVTKVAISESSTCDGDLTVVSTEEKELDYYDNDKNFVNIKIPSSLFGKKIGCIAVETKEGSVSATPVGTVVPKNEGIGNGCDAGVESKLSFCAATGLFAKTSVTNFDDNGVQTEVSCGTNPTTYTNRYSSGGTGKFGIEKDGQKILPEDLTIPADGKGQIVFSFPGIRLMNAIGNDNAAGVDPNNKTSTRPLVCTPNSILTAKFSATPE